MQRKANPARAIRAGVLVTAAAVAAQSLSQWIDFRVFDLRLRTLDSDHHASVFGAASIGAQAAAAAAIWLRAWKARSRAGLIVAALLAVLSVLRALMRYEPVFERYNVAITALPLGVAFAVLCVLTFRDPRAPRVVVWAGLGLLACSFVLHAVGPAADAAEPTERLTHTWSYQATGMIKHGAELAGWLLLATGIAAGHLASREARLRRAVASAWEQAPLGTTPR